MLGFTAEVNKIVEKNAKLHQKLMFYVKNEKITQDDVEMIKEEGFINDDVVEAINDWFRIKNSDVCDIFNLV